MSRSSFFSILVYLPRCHDRIYQDVTIVLFWCTCYHSNHSIIEKRWWMMNNIQLKEIICRLSTQVIVTLSVFHNVLQHNLALLSSSNKRSHHIVKETLFGLALVEPLLDFLGYFALFCTSESLTLPLFLLSTWLKGGCTQLFGWSCSAVPTQL